MLHLITSDFPSRLDTSPAPQVRPGSLTPLASSSRESPSRAAAQRLPWLARAGKRE